MQGKDHAKVASVVYAGAVAGAWFLYSTGQEELAVGVALGGFTGWLLTPDIDVNGTTYEEYRLYKLFWPLGLLWQNFWSPYGLIFAHRGWSHTPFIGTLTRIVYIVIAVTLAILTFNEYIFWMGYDENLKSDVFLAFRFISQNVEMCIAWYLLWSLQDILHYVADKWSTAAKKEARRSIRKGEDW